MKSPEQLAVDVLTDWVEQNTPEGHGLLVPVSGGSDSALAAYVCSQAVGDRASGIYFGDSLRSQDWFEQQMSIEVVESYDDNLDAEASRWAHVITRGLVDHEVIVGTRNRTEDVLGTYSSASKVAAMLPLVGVWKTDVMRLCQYIDVPQEIIDSSRQADDDCGRPENLAAIPFDVLDDFLKVKVGELPLDTKLAIGEDELAYLESVYAKNRFKDLLPYVGPRVKIY